MRAILSTLLAAAVLLGVTADARGQGLRVAAASDLQTILPELASRFEKATGVAVQVTFGSSGNFFSQIQNGAPFDVFLSADIDYPRRLQDAGFAQPGTLVPYGTGRLALWTRKESGVDLRGGLTALLSPAVRRVAIANPAHAPYGRAAIAALRHERLYDKVRDRLVLGENILQAAQFVQSGNADAGIIALSLAKGTTLRTAGVYVEIPASLHPPIEQGAVVLKGARNSEAARRFLAFLRRTEIVDLLKSAGFEPVRP